MAAAAGENTGQRSILDMGCVGSWQTVTRVVGAVLSGFLPAAPRATCRSCMQAVIRNLFILIPRVKLTP